MVRRRLSWSCGPARGDAGDLRGAMRPDGGCGHSSTTRRTMRPNVGPHGDGLTEGDDDEDHRTTGSRHAARDHDDVAVVEPALGAAAPPPHLRTLEPGEEVLVDSPIRVNLVMVGYEPGSFDVDPADRPPSTTSRPLSAVHRTRGTGSTTRWGRAGGSSTCRAFAGVVFDDAVWAPRRDGHGRAGGAPGPVLQRPGAQPGLRDAWIPRTSMPPRPSGGWSGRPPGGSESAARTTPCSSSTGGIGRTSSSTPEPGDRRSWNPRRAATSEPSGGPSSSRTAA